MVRVRDADERHDQQKHDAYKTDDQDGPEKIAHGMLLSRERRPPRAISAHLQYTAYGRAVARIALGGSRWLRAILRAGLSV